MPEKNDFLYECALYSADFLPGGAVKPSALLNLIQGVAGRHLMRIGLGARDMANRDAAFVLSSVTAEIFRSPAPEEPLFCGTWHSQTKPPFFRRDLVFRDSFGSVSFAAAAFSVVIGLSDRKLVRRFELPPELGAGSGIFAVEDARTSVRVPSGLEPAMTRKVLNSELDILGHVNNARYAEFAVDALSPEQTRRQVRRFSIGFSAELTEGEAFRVQTGRNEDMAFFEGVRERDGRRSFSAVFEYAKAPPFCCTLDPAVV